MSEIKERLSNATADCLAKYDTWHADQSERKGREELLDALHELRKAAARLEIEMAISERDQMASNPIPIPAHRSSKRQHGGGKDGNRDNSAPKPKRSKSSSGKSSSTKLNLDSTPSSDNKEASGE